MQNMKLAISQLINHSINQSINEINLEQETQQWRSGAGAASGRPKFQIERQKWPFSGWFACLHFFLERYICIGTNLDDQETCWGTVR